MLEKVKKFSRKEKPYFLFLVVFLIGSSYQLGGIFLYRWLLPFVSFMIAGWFLVKFEMSQNKIIFKNYLIIPLIFFVCFVTISLLSDSSIDSKLEDLAKIFFAFGSSTLILYLASHLTHSKLVKAVDFYHISAILFLILEAYTRLEPFYGVILSYSFSNSMWQLKTGSLFFNDSNAAAIFALFNLLIIISNHRGKFFLSNRLDLLFTFFYLIIIILSYSRASYISVIIVFSFYYFDRIFRVIFIKYIIYSLVLSAVFLFVFYDNSGLTKLKIYNDLLANLWSQELQAYLFGVGYSKGGFIYGYELGGYGHSSIALLLGYYGVFGFIFYLSFFGLFSLAFWKKIKYFLIGFFIISLSYLPPFL